MQNKSRDIHEFILSDNEKETKGILVSLCFQQSGSSKGLFLHVSPVTTIKPEKGSPTQSILVRPMAGRRMLVKPMVRFSQKQVDTFKPEKDDVQNLLNIVCRAEGMDILDANLIPSDLLS
ncbi:hypothetical protein [Vibrio alginolyticus]|uniref:hypothetical protein n=1 Tax=Vibrio TaxID=662 RepID=UPI0006CA910D|nr:hypothetical protein [Vibrio alginolyticus]KPM97602.1 hypothetical protein AOG25_14130 [Vibrio alginolyticus]CAH7369778.1 conserved hypothetical protein [Vibrio chagasii]